MGGVEDDRPPSKRVKVCTLELNGFSSVSTLPELDNPLGGLMAKPLSFHGKDEVIGPIGIKRVEFVRIITKALYSLGYERSGALLEEESGIHLHTRVVKIFRKQLLDGSWDESLITLQKIGITDENILKKASFFIMEQKFFDHLNNNRDMDALKTLRSEISPLCINSNQVHKLAGCIICPSQRDVHGFGGQGVNSVHSRFKLLEALQKLLPPTIMIPERRLEQLVEQALNVQKEACIFHNSSNNALSLYSDHQCGRDKIPSNCLQVLHAHSDDIWFLQFSNNGRYLASSSKDKSAIIWEVQGDGEVTLKHRLTGHEKPVIMVAWSPDDEMLLTCGQDEVVWCWNIQSGTCSHVYEKSGLNLISCGWLPDGNSIIAGLSDRSICMWSLDGKELECWKGRKTIKISDIAVTANSKWILTMCKENTILLFDKEANVESVIKEEQIITSFSLSRDSNFLLLNLLNQEIHLWRIVEDIKLIGKYKGHKRSRFVIRSCFGGIDEGFIASGSEDSQVYIWHRSTGELIEALPGHSGTINCVSWNPANPHMLASGSDDHTVRIWGLSNSNSMKQNVVSGNGIIHCNGNST